MYCKEDKRKKQNVHVQNKIKNCNADIEKMYKKQDWIHKNNFEEQERKHTKTIDGKRKKLHFLDKANSEIGRRQCRKRMINNGTCN